MYNISYVDGIYQNYENSKVNINDRGYHFGDSVYEVVLFNKGIFYDFEGHLNRLFNSLNSININFSFSKQSLIIIIKSSDLFKIFSKSDLLLFPSLRDSGGFVVLEAMSYGVPVSTLNLGGPGQIVNNECGIKIEVGNKTENEIILELTSRINYLFNNRDELFNSIKNYKEKYNDKNNVPRPSHWSGWNLFPLSIEFWLDGENRIHERLKYTKDSSGKWIKSLLSP